MIAWIEENVNPALTDPAAMVILIFAIVLFGIVAAFEHLDSNQ